MSLQDLTLFELFFGADLTKRQKVTKGLSAFLILGVISVGIIYLLNHREIFIKEANAQQTTERLQTVQATAVEPAQGYSVNRHYTGDVVPRRVTELSFEIPGRVIQVMVQDGDRVKEGQVIATLEGRKLNAGKTQLEAAFASAKARLDEMIAGPRAEKLAQARAQVAALDAQIALNKKQLDRAEKLRAMNTISEDQLDRLRFGLQSLRSNREAAYQQYAELKAGTRKEQILAQKAQVAGLKAQLQSLLIDIDNATLKAPFAGTVAKRHLSEGTVVNAGVPVIRLVESDALEARIGVPIEVLKNPQLQVGQDVDLELLGGQVAKATVTTHMPEIDLKTRTSTLRLSFKKNPDAVLLKPGQVARLTLTRAIEQQGFWMPLTALARSDRGLWACYVLVEVTDGDADHYELKRCDVEVLHSKGSQAYIRGPLKKGSKIVRGGLRRLVPGQRVRLLP